VDLDLDLLGLGQHGDRRRRGVDAPRRLGDRDALHAVHPALVLEGRVGALAANLEDHLFVAAVVVLVGGEDLDLEALGLRVTGVHARQFAGEDAGFVAAGAGADLDDHVFAVVRVVGQRLGADLGGELVEPLAALDELLLRKLTQLVVGLGLGVEQRLGLGRHPLGVAIAHDEVVRLLQPRMAAGHLRVARPVAEHVRVGELCSELVVGPLDLVDEVVDHGRDRSGRDGPEAGPRPSEEGSGPTLGPHRL